MQAFPFFVLLRNQSHDKQVQPFTSNKKDIYNRTCGALVWALIFVSFASRQKKKKCILTSYTGTDQRPANSYKRSGKPWVNKLTSSSPKKNSVSSQALRGVDKKISCRHKIIFLFLFKKQGLCMVPLLVIASKAKQGKAGRPKVWALKMLVC